VLEARPVNVDDRVRLLAASGYREPDFSVPCAEPSSGWPARRAEWPGQQIAALDGYAGAWVDESQQVMTVKFVGELDAAEVAVRRYYPDALCIVAAERTETELTAIQRQLMALSSVRVLSSNVVVDATGEWVEATIVAPNPALQASLAAQFGESAVRIVSTLVPVS